MSPRRRQGTLILGSLGGALSPDGFVLDGTTYTVQLPRALQGRASGWALDPELPVDFCPQDWRPHLSREQ